MTQPAAIRHITLDEVIDPIDGAWAEYACTVELSNGTVLHDCVVQSDGRTIDFASLRDRNGDDLHARLTRHDARIEAAIAQEDQS